MAKERKKVRAPNLDKYITKTNRKRYVSYYEGARLYNMAYAVFMRAVKEAGANYPIRKTVIVDLDRFDKYMEEQAALKQQEEINEEEASEMARKQVEHLQELVEAGAKKFIRIDEGVVLYSMGRKAFRKMAEDAEAIYKIGGSLLVNVSDLEAYIVKQAFKEKEEKDIRKNRIKRK